MINFTHYLPTRFVFGRGVENQTGEHLVCRPEQTDARSG